MLLLPSLGLKKNVKPLYTYMTSVFKKILVSLLNLLQYCFCFMFCFFWLKACGILAPQPGNQPAPPALEGKVLTTGPPGKSLHDFVFSHSPSNSKLQTHWTSTSLNVPRSDIFWLWYAVTTAWNPLSIFAFSSVNTSGLSLETTSYGKLSLILKSEGGVPILNFYSTMPPPRSTYHTIPPIDWCVSLFQDSKSYVPFPVLSTVSYTSQAFYKITCLVTNKYMNGALGKKWTYT